MKNNNYSENTETRKIPDTKNEKFSPPLDIPASPFRSCPETCEEIINTYGTYNIQPTANRASDFPAIAQGTPDYMKKRSKEFFRGDGDKNPASDTSDEHCV